MEAISRDQALIKGVNIHQGKITYEAVAKGFGMEYTPLQSMKQGR